MYPNKIDDVNGKAGNKCYIIAEIGVNHNGDLGLACKLIDSAKECGADAVKFQTFRAKDLSSRGTPKVAYQKLRTAKSESHYEMLEKLELGLDDHILLKNYCEQKNIDFLSTPYDLESARFLVEKLNVKAIKTASADLVDHQMQLYLATTNQQVFISTGMASLGEIEATINLYKQANSIKDVTLLHCVANYPCSDSSLNLEVLKTLRQCFGCQVGYSDHSVDSIAAILSIAYEARVIEKHFTLDKHLEGPDHAASSTPSELRELIDAVRRAELMIGSSCKECQLEEMEMASISRKSIVFKESLEAGTILSEENLTMKRPGDGILGDKWKQILCRRLRKKGLEGEKLRIEDLE